MRPPVRKYSVSIRRRGKKSRAYGVGSPWWRAFSRSDDLVLIHFPRDRHRRRRHRVVVVVVVVAFSRRPCSFAFKLSPRYSRSATRKVGNHEERRKGRRGARGGKRRKTERVAPLFLSLQYLAAMIFSGRFALRLTIAGNYLPSTSRAQRVLYLRRFHGGFIVTSSSSPRRYLSLSLCSPVLPSPLATARPRTIEDEPIGGDGGGLVFLLSLALDHFARLFTSPM